MAIKVILSFESILVRYFIIRPESGCDMRQVADFGGCKPVESRQILGSPLTVNNHVQKIWKIDLQAKSKSVVGKYYAKLYYNFITVTL